MKLIYKITCALVFMACLSFAAKAAGWPANYQGVMLQGFWWDSYKQDTKWTKLEARADEFAGTFSLIWVPNSGKSSGGLGYMPIYWFTNHNSDMGKEAELLSMIQTFKSKGILTIADVVINHRAGASNWTNFPQETWNGQTWKIGTEGICCTDEVNSDPAAAGQARATGAADTGEDFNGARDLDHTNANVQNNCKNYCKCLLEKYGYAGFRLDMVKGYAGRFTKIYNEYSRPTFSVGEHWSGYDEIAAWIEATGKTSAAFDFPFKYACNEAFTSGDYTKLVWKANGVTDQPAGLVHFNYRQYAVTFIDNHDTYRDGSKFNGNVVAANAYMICSPGTPCVFLPHWNAYKAQIKKFIDIRNSCGVHNMSEVRVLQSSRDCYMAEVTGTKGKLVIKVGPSMTSPAGYSDSDIKASGDGYCIWTKTAITGGGGGGIVDTYPSTLYAMGHVNGSDWKPNKGVAASGKNGVYTFSNITIDKSSDKPYGYVAFATGLGASATDWDSCNGNDRYGSATEDEVLAVNQSGRLVKYVGGMDASSCNSFAMTPGKYTITVDLKNMTVKYGEGTGGGGTTPTPDPGSYPASLYLMGHVNGYKTADGSWDPTKGIVANCNNGSYIWNNVTIDDAGDGHGYFSIVSALSPIPDDWDAVNGADRYGAYSEDELLSVNKSADIVLYPVDISAMGAFAWKAPADKYNITADLANMKITLSSTSGINSVYDDETPIYFNLQGMRVENPERGIYIRVCGREAHKVVVH